MFEKKVIVHRSDIYLILMSLEDVLGLLGAYKLVDQAAEAP